MKKRIQKNSSAVMTAMIMMLAAALFAGCEKEDDPGARDSYTGSYGVTQTLVNVDGTTVEGSYTVTVTASDADGEILIANFMGYGSGTEVRATVKGNSFTIPRQTIVNLSVSAEIKGSGKKKGDTLTYSFDIEVEDGRRATVKCEAVRN